jgi:hypothetical protein
MLVIDNHARIKKIKESEIFEHLSNGTSLQGYINTSYDKLVEAFGQPIDGDGYKVDAEWKVLTPEGIATIYNYKDGKNYLGKEGTKTEKIAEWHIGGHNKGVVSYITEALR